MALEEQSRSNDTSSEHSREAFIQEAVTYAQRTFALEQELANIQIGHATQKRTYGLPNASYTPSRREITGHPPVSNRSQSAKTELAINPTTPQFVRQLEALGVERRLMPQVFRAANHEIEQAIQYVSHGALEDVGNEQLTSPATPAGRNSTSRLAVTARGQSGARTSRILANETQPVRRSVPEVSVKPQGSLDHSNLDCSSGAIGSSLIEGPKGKHTNDLAGKQWSGSISDTAKRSTAPMKTDVARIDKQDRKSLPSVEASQSKGSLVKLPRTTNLSQAQLELEIQMIMPLTSGNLDIQLSEADFDRIAETLLQANREEWSYRPRTYALLRMINGTDLMDDFVKDDCLDIALPYARSNLPKSLSPEQRDRFLEKQRSVMTATSSIEGGLKAKHANFADSADNHLEVLGKLGEGGSGEVDRIRSKLSRKIYVRKRLKRQETFEQNAEALKLFKREVDHLKKLKHRHLVRYIGSYTDPRYVGIIMDPVAEKDLEAFLSQGMFKPAEYACIREAFGCLCSAVVYLHSQNVRHKDIKPQNILVKERKVFITDFGLAINWKTLGRSTTTGDHGPISRQYAAPEVMDNDSRNTGADIWSLGCVYLDMLTVLKGETSIAKAAYFMSNGTCSLFYSANQEAFRGWMKKLQSRNDNAPLDWIRNMTMVKPESRLKAQQLMDRILCSEDEKYYGLCCDGKMDDHVAIELRNSDIEGSSGSEDTSNEQTSARKALDSVAVEKQICKAAGAQDVKMLKKWLRKILHMRNRGLNTKAIHYAASNGNEEIVDILITFGCKLEYKFNGYTPLASAIQYSREGTTELLANTGIAINAGSVGSQSALHLATRRSFHAGMRILLRARAIVDIRDQSQCTPLHLAVAQGGLLSTKLLLENGADPSLTNSLGISALQLAARGGFNEIVQTLLDHGAEIDGHNTSGQLPGLRPALAVAVMYNKPITVRLLLQRGANVDIQTSHNGQILPSPLHLATAQRLSQVVDILLQHKPDLELRDNRNQTPLLIACRLLDSQIVQSLLTAGANVRAEDKSLDELIHDLLRRQSFPILQQLVDHGASLEGRGSPLHSAVAAGEVEITEFLLKNHLPVDAKDARNSTSLMVAAEYKQEASVRLLVRNGASINAQNHWGDTALHFAVFANSAEIVSLLLEYGSDPLVVTRDGLTSFDLAVRYDRKEIHGLIIEALEITGRLVFDSRWPGVPFFLTLDEVQHGYEIKEEWGRPMIKALSASGIKPKATQQSNTTRGRHSSSASTSRLTVESINPNGTEVE